MFVLGQNDGNQIVLDKVLVKALEEFNICGTTYFLNSYADFHPPIREA